MEQKYGIFPATDTLHNPIILEWEEIQGNTDELAQKIKSLSDILTSSYAQTEVEFAHKMPELVPNDFMLKSLAPLLDQGADAVDWDLFQQKTEEHLNQFFATTDWKAYSSSQEVHIFILARDKKTNNPLGVIQFFTKSDFPKGSIKAALFGVIPSAQDRGIEKILMSALFKIFPNIQRIFLHTRSTNTKAISAYKAWGFFEYESTLPNWTNLEYLADQTNTLQNVAEMLK
jgi:ribosomal protein S18 acetylase RimI-like enzyme